MGTDLFTVPHFLIILKKWLHIASLKLPISLFCPLYELFRHFYVHMHLFINFRSTFAESQGKIAEWKIIFLCKLYYVRYNFLFSGKSLETRKKDYEKGKENDVGQWSIVGNSIIIFHVVYAQKCPRCKPLTNFVFCRSKTQNSFAFGKGDSLSRARRCSLPIYRRF